MEQRPQRRTTPRRSEQGREQESRVGGRKTNSRTLVSQLSAALYMQL